MWCARLVSLFAHRKEELNQLKINISYKRLWSGEWNRHVLLHSSSHRQQSTGREAISTLDALLFCRHSMSICLPDLVYKQLVVNVCLFLPSGRQERERVHAVAMEGVYRGRYTYTQRCENVEHF